MKIALVSDIHAHSKALKRVFDDLPSVDRVLCAGDAVSEYLFCPETVDQLRHANVQCIQGNHEHVLFGGQNPAYLAKCRAQFDADLLDVLADAPTTFELEAAGARVLMVHATPWQPFAGYINPGSPQLPRLAAMPYDFIILGHTHRAMIEQAGSVMVINPGSCSEPRDQSRIGSYALLDLASGHAEIRRVPLD